MKTFINLVEKVAMTWVQVFVTGLLAADALGVSAAEAAAIAAIPAAVAQTRSSKETIPSGRHRGARIQVSARGRQNPTTQMTDARNGSPRNMPLWP